MKSDTLLSQFQHYTHYKSTNTDQSTYQKQVKVKPQQISDKENVVLEHNDVEPEHLKRMPVFRAKKMSMKMADHIPAEKLKNHPSKEGGINCIKSTRLIKKPKTSIMASGYEQK